MVRDIIEHVQEILADAGWDKALFLVGDLFELGDCEYCDTDDDHPAVALVCWRTETEETEPEPFRREDALACADAIIPAMTEAEAEPGFHDAWVEMRRDA